MKKELHRKPTASRGVVLNWPTREPSFLMRRRYLTATGQFAASLAGGYLRNGLEGSPGRQVVRVITYTTEMDAAAVRVSEDLYYRLGSSLALLLRLGYSSLGKALHQKVRS